MRRIIVCWFFGFTMTLGWRIVNVGDRLVRWSGETRNRHYPTTSGAA